MSPLAQREVRVVFAAQTVSGLGDWAGRLALAVLVFDRSQSAVWAAAVTVVSLLPWLGPGQLLATAADRFGRIRVMVASDLARAALFALMLVPQQTWSLLLLAFGAGLAVPPFVGSRSSAMVELIEPDRYPAALALYGVLTQAEILIGYAAGGLLVAAAGARTALAINMTSFLVSAALIASLRASPAAAPNRQAMVGWAGVRAGARVWRADPVAGRALTMFVGVSMFMVLPEALVVPLTAELGVGERWVGVFAALVAIGTMVGMISAPSGSDHVELLNRTGRRGAVVAVAAGAGFGWGITPVVAAIAIVLSGMVDAVAVPTNQVVGQRLQADGRAAAMTVAAGVQYSAQVVAISVAATAAHLSSTRAALAVAMFAAAAVCLWSVGRPLPAPE